MSEIPSMKSDKKAEEFRTGRILGDNPDKEEYPHGLSIHLEDEQLEKLGIQAMPRIGERMHIKGFIQVKSITENEHEGEGKKRSMTLQITHLKLELVDKDRSHDQVFYGEPVKPKVI